MNLKYFRMMNGLSQQRLANKFVTKRRCRKTFCEAFDCRDVGDGSGKAESGQAPGFGKASALHGRSVIGRLRKETI